MDDLISRQDAIETVRKAKNLYQAHRRLVQLPSAQQEQRWIPCSERLPEAEYPAIVTWKNDDPASYYQYILGKHYAGVAHYKNGKWYWYSSVTEDVLMEYGRYESEEFDEAIKVLAWMPLPEPYKENPDADGIIPRSWLYDEDTGSVLCRCPVCGGRIRLGCYDYWNPYHYCPYCGEHLSEGRFIDKMVEVYDNLDRDTMERVRKEYEKEGDADAGTD